MREPERQALQDLVRRSRDGREVYRCWLRSEARGRFWHDLGTGLAGRQPL